jgi:hypothetical protein
MPFLSNICLLIEIYSGYKVTCFEEDDFGVNGKQLDPICRDPADIICGASGMNY